MSAFGDDNTAGIKSTTARTVGSDQTTTGNKTADLVTDMSNTSVDADSNVTCKLDTTASRGDTQDGVETRVASERESSADDKGKEPIQEGDDATNTAKAEEDEDAGPPSLDGINASVEALRAAMITEFPEFAKLAKDSASAGASSEAGTERRPQASAPGSTKQPSAADAAAFFKSLENVTRALNAIPGLLEQVTQNGSDIKTADEMFWAAFSGNEDEAKRLRRGLSQDANDELTKYMKRYQEDETKAQQEVLDKWAELMKMREEGQEDKKRN